MSVEIALIAAVAENGVIGDGGELPWYYPEDLAHFKETTMGHPVIVGRRTFQGILDRLGEPLPGRTNVVLTRRGIDREDVRVANSIEEAIEFADSLGDLAYVIGGEAVYEAFLSRADRLVLTEIHDTYEGDAYFPEVDSEEWTAVDRDDRDEFSFVEYERRDERDPA